MLWYGWICEVLIEDVQAIYIEMADFIALSLIRTYKWMDIH